MGRKGVGSFLIFFRKGADLCAGLSKSTQCAGAAKGPTFASTLPGHRRERVDTVRVGAATGPTFASALVVDGRYLCSCVRVCVCESRVSTDWQVGSGLWT